MAGHFPPQCPRACSRSATGHAVNLDQSAPLTRRHWTSLTGCVDRPETRTLQFKSLPSKQLLDRQLLPVGVGLFPSSSAGYHHTKATGAGYIIMRKILGSGVWQLLRSWPIRALLLSAAAFAGGFDASHVPWRRGQSVANEGNEGAVARAALYQRGV
jgi:hypothetical protein